MDFSKLFRIFFKKEKKIKVFDPPSKKDVEDAAKYRLVYNPKRNKYEKI